MYYLLNVFYFVIACLKNGRSNNVQLTPFLFCLNSLFLDTRDTLDTFSDVSFDSISQYMVFGYVISRNNLHVAF